MGQHALARALAIPAVKGSGTIQDVAHVVVLTQENRSFDHYFGALRGVRGWSDAQGRTSGIQPFHLDTRNDFGLMRAEGTPHSWLDAQEAWDHGRMARWAQVKGAHSGGYYQRADLPFHYARADAFTVCDAYHCSFQGGTNTNRLFLWTGTNDPQAQGNGPALYNELDSQKPKPGVAAYTWTTYAQRLQDAGVSWQVYQDMADNYDDNPLAGFEVFRQASLGLGPQAGPLRQRGLSTRTVVQLKADVLRGNLPQVSWIVASAKDSEHPEHSSPAQGAHFTAQVLQALTANPEVWARTVLIINFDENDGYYDHVPPPAVPSYVRHDADPAKAILAGASTVSTAGEYHEKLAPYHDKPEQQAMLHRPYGLGPRVPMLVVSPWSRGGWVNSQVFDHTSVIRFMERCFGVMEPQISAWRRSVCGDLTSTLDFSHRSLVFPKLPATAAAARRASALTKRQMPVVAQSELPAFQEKGQRPSRALPYELHVHSRCDHASRHIDLRFVNTGRAGAVFHVYDRLSPDSLPRRYTVGAGAHLSDTWQASEQHALYDLLVTGPNGYLRSFRGRLGSSNGAAPEVLEMELRYRVAANELELVLHNFGSNVAAVQVDSLQRGAGPVRNLTLAAGDQHRLRWSLAVSGGWYDLQVQVADGSGLHRRMAGRMETGRNTVNVTENV
jgi:phospholipase C